jgi:hypothetical protein
LNPNKPRFHKDYFIPGVLDCTRYAAVTAADIEKGAAWRKVSHRFHNAVISVLKPERRVFDREK